MGSSLQSRAFSGFFWSFFQKIGTQVVNFIISIVLARILVPEDYGVVAMITIFTNIAMVFINTGFSSALIQKKELTKADINTMFYSGIALSLVLYGVLFFCAPHIAVMYKEPELTDLFRVESLIVVICALYSVQQALITRELTFKKLFIVNIIGVFVQGFVGIFLANKGFGPWALVYSTLANNIVVCLCLWVVVKWKPSFIFSVNSFKSMFSFSAKMLASGLLDSLFNNIRSLIIGTRYSSEDLAYYNRGYQFPTLIMTQVDGSLTKVLFTFLSKFQENWTEGLRKLRKSLRLSLYICAPLMAGMCAVADPMIRILLTDKWESSIVYVRLGCIICMFWPLSAQRHALNALGKSDVSLKMNIIGKTVTVICLLLTYRHSVWLMIASSIFASTICLFINAVFYKKHLNYLFKEQIADILPPVLLSAIMGVITYLIMFLNLSSVWTLLIQVPTGILAYVVGSAIFKFDSFFYLLALIKGFFSKIKRKKELL